LKSLNGKKILLVEDNEHNQILAKAFIERSNGIVEIAGNGKIALDMLTQNPAYDLIVMDIQMPIMDGLQTTSQIRKKLKINTPIIGCSAHALASERNMCLETGMNDYITKPYTEAELVGSIAYMLEYGIGQAKHESENSTATPDQFDAVFEAIKKEFGPDAKVKLLRAMVKRVPNDLENLQKMMHADDFKHLAELIHNLAGSFGSLKMFEGLELAREHENAVKKNNKEMAKITHKRLSNYLERFMHYSSELPVSEQ
jgi:CheY-like chemotaxis protein